MLFLFGKYTFKLETPVHKIDSFGRHDLVSWQDYWNVYEIYSVIQGPIPTK